MTMASPAFLRKPCLFVHRQSISMAFTRNLSSVNHKVSPRHLIFTLNADARRVETSRSLPGTLMISSSRFKLFSTQAFPNNSQNSGYGGASQNPNNGNISQGNGYGNSQQSQQPWQQNNGPNPNYGNFRNANPGNQQAQQPSRPQQQSFGSANNQQSQQQGFGLANNQQSQQQGFGSANNQQSQQQGFGSANNQRSQQQGFGSANTQQPQQGSPSGPPPPRTSAAAQVIEKHLGPSTLKLEKRDGNSPPPPPPPRNRNFGSQGNQEKKSGKDLVAESAACAVIEKYLGPWPGFPPRDPKIDEYLDSLPENAACIAIDKYFGPYKPLFVFKKNEANANNPPPPPNRPPRNRMMNRARNRTWNPSQQDQQPWAGSQSGGYQGQGTSGMHSQQTHPPPQGNNPSNASLQNPQGTSSVQSPQGSQVNDSSYQGSQGSNPASQGSTQ